MTLARASVWVLSDPSSRRRSAIIWQYSQIHSRVNRTDSPPACDPARLNPAPCRRAAESGVPEGSLWACPLEVVEAGDTLRWETVGNTVQVTVAEHAFLARRGSLRVGPGSVVADIRHARRERGRDGA